MNTIITYNRTEIISKYHQISHLFSDSLIVPQNDIAGVFKIQSRIISSTMGMVEFIIFGVTQIPGLWEKGMVIMGGHLLT